MANITKPIALDETLQRVADALESFEGIGIQGPPGPGVPAGGTTGKILAKKTGTDYDTEWVDAPSGGGDVDSVNGQTGQVQLDAGDINVNNSAQTPETIEDALGDVNRALTNLEDKKADVIIASASGAITSFADGADDMPLKSCVVQIEPVQSGSGDPAPDNVRPITGWTGANVQRAGKNLMPYPYDISKPTNYASAWNGTTIDGEWVVQTSYGIAAGGFGGVVSGPLKAGTYAFSFDVDSSHAVDSSYSVSVWSENIFGNAKGVNKSNDQTSSHYSNTVVFDVDVVAFAIRVTSKGNSNDSVVKYKNIQLELGSTATAYEPYQGQTYPISWQTEAGTVYGGYVDPVNGELVVDRASVDLGTLTWIYNSNWGGGGAFYCDTAPSGIKTDNPTQSVPNALCSCYTAYARDTLYSNSGFTGFCIPNNTAQVSIRDSAYTDAATFKSAMSGVKLVYELAEPITYQLTPVEIRTLLGQNNIWADTGDVAVQYPADTKAYVDGAVQVADVQVAGVSVLQDGIANIPLAGTSTRGVVKLSRSYGIDTYGSGANESLGVIPANTNEVKGGYENYDPIVPSKQHESAFFGLAKAAGDSTQSASANTVGTYTESAKSVISQMLNAPETVTGTTPSITAKAGVRYVCGECSTLTIVVPATGCIDVLFNSGSTATVLTVTPPTGWSMKWANSFDPTSLESNTTYEVNILMKPDTNECIGVVGSWT